MAENSSQGKWYGLYCNGDLIAVIKREVFPHFDSFCKNDHIRDSILHSKITEVAEVDVRRVAVDA